VRGAPADALRSFRLPASGAGSLAGCVLATPEAVAREAADRLLAASRDAIAARGRFALALAGGRTPALLHRTLAGLTVSAWERWEVFFGDERAVPHDHPASNYGNARRDLLARVPIPPARVHPLYAPGEDLDAQALAYERLLVDRLGPEPALDAVVLGVGRDAHTLSLHPRCPLLRATSRLVAALRDPPMDPPLARLTLTPAALHRARLVLVLATGADKSSAVRALCAAPDDPFETPIQIVRGCTGEVLVLLDAAADGAAAL